MTRADELPNDVAVLKRFILEERREREVLIARIREEATAQLAAQAEGLENEQIAPGEEIVRVAGKIECRERLDGMLKYYYRAAA